MRIGMAASADADATIARCRQLGVDSVFVGCASIPGYRETGIPDRDALRALKSDLERADIDLLAACVWFAQWPPRPWRDGSTNPDVLLTRDRVCIEAMKRTLEVVSSCGIPAVLHYVDLGKPEDPAQSRACWEGLIEIYRELVPVAEDGGIGLANHSLHRLLADGVRERAVAAGITMEDYGTYAAEGWGGPFLVGDWRDLARLIEAVPSPANGVALCTGLDIVGGDVPGLVRAFAGRIHFCQLRDHTDRWPAGREALPGAGRVDLAAVVNALHEVGYRGVVHPEHLGKPEGPHDDPLAKAIPHVRSLLGAAGRA